MHLTKSFFSLIKITLSFGILPFLQKITYNKVVPKLQYYIITYSILRFHLINFKPYSKGVENEKAVFIRSMLDTSKLLDTCFKCFQNKQMIDPGSVSALLLFDAADDLNDEALSPRGLLDEPI